jgi:hypothetical protein
MRYSVLALAGGSMFAAVAIAGLKLHSQAQAAPEISPTAAVEAFRLQASGDPAGCAIEKAIGGGPLVGVSVAQDCDGLLPGLSKIRYWREDADGTVTLSADGKTASVVFGPADGVAYESLKPRAPLMSLIASN